MGSLHLVNLPKFNYGFKAGGSAIPAKWRITGPNGEDISDPSSFAGLYSYQVPLEAGSINFEAQPPPAEDWAVENTSTGALSPAYMGGGNGQFDWKTPKSYAGQCRVMVLKLNDNSTYQAWFHFPTK
jgi:hypothetical protein